MRTLTSILIGLLTLIFAGCSHNNGNIGNWFGTWHVTEITVNGETLETYNQNMYFKFQANICDIITVSPHHDNFEHFARFQEQDNHTILIDFGHTDEWNPVEFDAPAESLLENGPNVLKVSNKGSRKKILTLDKEDGTTINYTLRKQ